ncbi:cytidine deaminase-like protein [Peziza echinospora]|nr:cytidine deaminase-like protein [Peziza echinospora]
MSAPNDSINGNYLFLALCEAQKCIGTPTAFCVGAVLAEASPSPSTPPKILATGYSRELPGNTHAEEVCLAKLLENPPWPPTNSTSPSYILYTTMEPCSERLSGNLPCTDRILAYNSNPERLKKGLGEIKTVYVGVKEPSTFIKKNIGEEKLRNAGIEYIHLPGLEDEILRVAKEGHKEAQI